MSAPQLNRQLQLEEAVRVSDGAGGFAMVWQPVGTLWAEVRVGTGTAAGGEEVVLSTVTYRILVRGAPQGSARRPKPDQRFRDGARVFHILAVTEADALGQHLLCFAREETPK
jgi:head-tail adaptor